MRFLRAAAYVLIACYALIGMQAADKADKKKQEYTCTAAPYVAAKIAAPVPVRLEPFHFGIFDRKDPHAILAEVWADRMVAEYGAIDFFWYGERVARILPQSGLTYRLLPTKDEVHLKGDK